MDPKNGGVAVVEDAAVGRDEPVALARSAWRPCRRPARSAAGHPWSRGTVRRRSRRCRRRPRPGSSPRSGSVVTRHHRGVERQVRRVAVVGEVAVGEQPPERGEHARSRRRPRSGPGRRPGSWWPARRTAARAAPCVQQGSFCSAVALSTATAVVQEGSTCPGGHAGDDPAHDPAHAGRRPGCTARTGTAGSRSGRSRSPAGRSRTRCRRSPARRRGSRRRTRCRTCRSDCSPCSSGVRRSTRSCRPSTSRP